ncbi:MAG: OmpA family protein [Pyrinomonadaceae bacterium]
MSLRFLHKTSTLAFVGILSVAVIGTGNLVMAQQADNSQQSAQQSAQQQARTVQSGQKMKIQGVVVNRNADTFTVRDDNGVDTVVALNDVTRVIEKKGNPFRRARNYATTGIVRGLSVEVEGTGDSSGNLVAKSVRFSDTEFKVARSIDSRVNPVEGRVGSAEGRIDQVEQNAQRLSGQLDELTAVSNAARGGAKAAQDTADSAVAGVNATNERISALDDYDAQKILSVNFRSGSAVLSKDAKAQLDEFAGQLNATKGFMVEIRGFADSRGNTNFNRSLSQRRADAVVRYFAENHNVPLRRIITPFGYGEAQPVAENASRDGRAQNRRVEVKLLVSKGLMQSAPTMNVPQQPTAQTDTRPDKPE